ncbi:MAG: hypothetical protein NC434_10735 [Ruminococcus sp.]|nr:hypothetical protein [Ruminococcus sp.]
MEYESQEEQREGRIKETVINRSQIDSGEYRRKFDLISDNANLNKLIYQLAKKCYFTEMVHCMRICIGLIR